MAGTETVSHAEFELIDERRFDVPVVLVCPESSPDDARGWIDASEIPELRRVRNVSFVDIDSGHWPMVTRPSELARTIARHRHGALSTTATDAALGRRDDPTRTAPHRTMLRPVREVSREGRLVSRGVVSDVALVTHSDAMPFGAAVRCARCEVRCVCSAELSEHWRWSSGCGIGGTSDDPASGTPRRCRARLRPQNRGLEGSGGPYARAVSLVDQLTFRSFRGSEDYDGMAALINAVCRRAGRGRTRHG